MRRGDIHLLLTPGRSGRPGATRQHAVIVQADDQLPAPLILIAPTAQSARAESAGPLIDVDGTPTRVLVEMIGAVEPKYLGAAVGRLTEAEQAALDAAVESILGLA